MPPALRRAARTAVVALSLAGCAVGAPPQGETPFRPTPDMLAVLTAFQASGAKPVGTLTPEAARAQPTMAAAALGVAQMRGMGTEPMPVARVRDISVPGAAGPLPARVYEPAGNGAPKPVILYFHGGGWVIGTIDSYDASARALANGSGAIVVSVEYRKGPEVRFPGAHDDAVAAYRWVLANARGFGGDPRRVALAGESAGGNLAIDAAIAARDARLPMPVHELLVYPVAGTDTNTQSYRENARAMPLDRAAMLWFFRNYTTSPGDLQDPRLDVVGRADLAGLPPTTVVMAQIDPLRSEDEALAGKLRAAGVPTESRVYPGTTHEFFGLGAVVGDAKAAEDYAGARLRAAFAAVPAQPAAVDEAGEPGRHRRGRRHR